MKLALTPAVMIGLLFGALPMRAEKIELVAGGTEARTGIPATHAALKEPFGIEFDRAGNGYIVEMGGGRLLKVDPHGMLTQIAGQSPVSDAGDGGPAREAHFNAPHNLAVLPNGDILVADTWNGRVRQIDMKPGTIAALPGFNVAPAQAKASGPYSIALDSTATKLYIADLHRVQVIDLKTGMASVVAGNGQKGAPHDGAMAVDSPLLDPRAVAVDRSGNVYIIERGGHALCVVDRAGKIRTVVNASGKKGFSGDGGDAREALMNGPKHLCIDRDNSVLIADTENHVIRRYIPATGKIVRVAGTGHEGSAGLGGPPEQCELKRPHGVTVRHDGTIFISDSENNRVLKIVP